MGRGPFSEMYARVRSYQRHKAALQSVCDQLFIRHVWDRWQEHCCYNRPRLQPGAPRQDQRDPSAERGITTAGYGAQHLPAPLLFSASLHTVGNSSPAQHTGRKG